MKIKRIDAPRAWGTVAVVTDGRGRVTHRLCAEAADWKGYYPAGQVRVRILRESDYRKLLKEARR